MTYRVNTKDETVKTTQNSKIMKYDGFKLAFWFLHSIELLLFFLNEISLQRTLITRKRNKQILYNRL